MPKPPKSIEAKIRQVTSAWESLRPDQSFGGMTLEQFKTRVKASADARATIATADSQWNAAVAARQRADDASNKLLQLVINAVKGSPDEGEDGELYAAMGYVHKSERKVGRRGALTLKKAA
jgi:hypothetical protein